MPGEFDLGFPPHEPNLGRVAAVVSEAGTTIDQLDGMALYEPVTTLMAATDDYSRLSRQALRAPLKVISSAMDHATELAGRAVAGPSETIQNIMLAPVPSENPSGMVPPHFPSPGVLPPVQPPASSSAPGGPGGFAPAGAPPLGRGPQPGPAPVIGSTCQFYAPFQAPPGAQFWGFIEPRLNQCPLVGCIGLTGNCTWQDFVNYAGIGARSWQQIGGNFGTCADAENAAEAYIMANMSNWPGCGAPPVPPTPPPPPPPTPIKPPPTPPTSPPTSPPTPAPAITCIQSADLGWSMDDCSDADISNVYDKLGIDPGQLWDGQKPTDWWLTNWVPSQGVVTTRPLGSSPEE